MDFIERLLGVAPDGGNGLLEFSLFSELLVVALFAFRRALGRKAASCIKPASRN
jgi:hypothetical protein